LVAWIPFLAFSGGYSAAVATGYPLLFIMLLLIHLGLYGIKFAITMSRQMSWLFFLMQAVLVLALTNISRSMGVNFGLFLVLVTAAMNMFKNWYTLIGGLVSALVLYLVYTTSALTTGIGWNMPWPGAVYSLFFVSGICFSFFLQEKHALAHTQKLLNELETSHARLSAYALHIEELTALSERQRIARNLHDTLIQAVAGLLMQLEVVQSQLQHQRTTRAQEVLEETLVLTRDALADARYTLSDLRNEQIRPDDLVEIVQEEIARFRAHTKLTCTFSLAPLTGIPKSNCHHILRVISEGLSNVAEHAHARKAWIYVTNNQAELVVEIGDDGVGFDPDGIQVQDGHYGLLGIRERAKMLGGNLEIVSAKAKGTKLRLRIPHSVTAHRKEAECPHLSGSSS